MPAGVGDGAVAVLAGAVVAVRVLWVDVWLEYRTERCVALVLDPALTDTELL